MQRKWMTYECAAENGPSYWIVTDRAFRGNVAGKFATCREAQAFAEKLNRQAAQN